MLVLVIFVLHLHNVICTVRSAGQKSSFMLLFSNRPVTLTWLNVTGGNLSSSSNAGTSSRLVSFNSVIIFCRLFCIVTHARHHLVTLIQWLVKQQLGSNSCLFAKARRIRQTTRPSHPAFKNASILYVSILSLTTIKILNDGFGCAKQIKSIDCTERGTLECVKNWFGRTAI